MRIDFAHRRPHFFQFVGVNQICLVDNDDIGEGDLIFRLGGIVQAKREMFGVNQSDDGIKRCFGAHVFVHEEGLRYGGWISEACRFNQNTVETSAALQKVLNHTDEVSAHGAADATVVHFIDFFVGLNDQIIVDTDLAELVDDNRKLLPVIVGKDAVKKRGFARSEIAGEDRDGNLICHLKHLNLFHAI